MSQEIRSDNRHMERGAGKADSIILGDFQPSTDMACGIGNKNKHIESASDKIYYVN